jgi:hypothetical protein
MDLWQQVGAGTGEVPAPLLFALGVEHDFRPATGVTRRRRHDRGVKVSSSVTF